VDRLIMEICAERIASAPDEDASVAGHRLATELPCRNPAPLDGSLAPTQQSQISPDQKK
jgi:hypothetical protein